MECSESILCSVGELELDPDIVSEEAGKLYSELQTVMETHGAGVVESLVPTLVWVLEGLANCRAQLRESEQEVEKGRAEIEELMERYQSEKSLRRESQERYLELDDQCEQERRTVRAREKERDKREREVERKAREQADQLVSLEEQKASISRELNSLKHAHNKAILRPRGHSDCTPVREPAALGGNVIEIVRKPPTEPSFIDDIISSTPELSQLQDRLDASALSQTEVSEAGPRTSLEEELRQAAGKEEEEEPGVDEGVPGEDDHREKTEQEDGGVDEEEEEEDSLEWELRNTDSLFSELSELSRDYIDSVDHGASVRGSVDQLEEILSQLEELKHTHEVVDAARKALISRVEELTNDRSAVKLELTASQETASRRESRMNEMEQETKRLRKELEACQSEDPDADLPTSLRRFSRSEMARVVMEKNQYKERLFELQEAVRRSQILRKRELYRDVRSHIWGTLGKRQLNGWSVPLSHTQESMESTPEPKDVPALLQLRLLDQRDSSAKLNCAVAVIAEISGDAVCSVWVMSGLGSSSDITVIDPARSNTVLDQFSLPPTSPALCLCAVPPTGDWDLPSHQVMRLGTTPLQPIRCCLAKGGRLWVGYWNRVHVVDIESRKVEQTFSVSERSEQQVRFLCAAGSGVWTSCRLDPLLRLFDWSSGRPLQEVDLTPLVTKTLGQAFLSISPLQVSALSIISSCLWVGTGSGAIFSIPLSIRDDTSDGSSDSPQGTLSRSERSHMIIWQSHAPSVPSSAL
ncbi:hypothetical protein CRUP_006697 [Coryphaenoides rupestris]|nr:hypothetical protein CRUP_006697 [Coryphaenoides rupestris]